MTQLLQLLVTGITNGAIYALVALGFVTIYNVTGVINFAQGEFVMLGALTAISLAARGLPLPLAAALAVVVTALIGGGLQRFALHPARNASILSLIIITLGIGIALRGAALVIWGTQPYGLRPFTAGPPLRFLGAVVRLQSLWVVGTAVLMLVGLYLFFEFTLLGKAVRACSINRTAARLLGIPVDRMALLSFVLSAGLSAVAGIVITPASFATYDMGLSMGLKGFAAAILGGLANPVLAVVGGLLIGLIEALGAGFVASGYKEAFAFGTLLILLLTRSAGLFGRREAGWT